MSDGGRGRASLGVERWKSSQNVERQRSAVRSIAWLGPVRFDSFACDLDCAAFRKCTKKTTGSRVPNCVLLRNVSQIRLSSGLSHCALIMTGGGTSIFHYCVRRDWSSPAGPPRQTPERDTAANYDALFNRPLNLRTGRWTLRHVSEAATSCRTPMSIAQEKLATVIACIGLTRCRRNHVHVHVHFEMYEEPAFVARNLGFAWIEGEDAAPVTSLFPVAH